MKKISITTFVDHGSPFQRIVKNQQVVFTTEELSDHRIIALELHSENAFDTGGSQIILNRTDLINILNFLLKLESNTPQKNING